MALNFSRDSSFLTSPEMSPYQPLVDGYYFHLFDESSCFGDYWSICSFNKALEDNPCGELVNADLGGFDEPAAVVVDDILDRLPRDPFGMNIMKSTFPEFPDWFQDFDWHFPSEYDVFALDETHTRIDYEMSVSDEFFDRSFDSGVLSDGTVEAVLPTSHGDSWVSSGEAEELKNSNDGEAGSPHDAMRWVLYYLGVTDLLSVEQVCRSLRDSVRANPLLWWRIRIDQPLSLRITDGTLVKLTNRAQGFLQSLSLVNCARITDSGLRCVLQSNPRLTKLSVPGCTGLTVEGILLHLRALKSSGKPGIKHLQIRGLPQVTDKHIEEFKVLLDVDKYLQQRGQRPRFYRGWFSYTMCDDDRVIDIELCPICQMPTLVYDCPAESCRQKQQASQVCRGCIACIARCKRCGKCIKDVDYEETFCLDVICLNCWNQPMSFPEYISQRTTYKLCLVG